jgi:beta-lactamase superfamily II metal-dependent hydrolase
MSIVKSFSVGHGAMYYINHNSSNFTVIDCRLVTGATMEPIIKEIGDESRGKDIVRYISTHPDDDHIKGIIELDDAMGFRNVYCVRNSATREEPTDAFDYYCSLRDDSEKAFYVSRGCSRRWMNVAGETNGSAGINFQWPITSNADYKGALALAAEGGRANNISPIFTYSLDGGVRMMWMGDLETDFMERIKDELIDLPVVDILFAPHHGRDTPPKEWMKQLNPQIVVLGEADEEYLDPYTGYTKMRQSRAGDLTFECVGGKTHIYASRSGYSHKALRDEGRSNSHGYYAGTIDTPRKS